MITKKLLAICSIIAVVLAGSCKKDDFVEIDGVCPIVISTIPVNGATGVLPEQIISATFNEIMNAATINPASFTVVGTAPVQGTITYEGTTATFTPTSPLNPGTTYTCTIKAGIKDKSGNALQADYIWVFSTGNVLAPLVIQTSPANLETNVNINKTVTATFNMPMDPLSINLSTFTISLEGNKIQGVIFYSGVTASFDPVVDLVPNSTYTCTISKSVKNPAGVTIPADYVWTFTTGTLTAPMVISTDPANNDVDVELNKIVTATFSEPMDASTINNNTFTLKQGINLVKGKITYLGSTATFTPDEAFLPGALYTGTISKEVKNPAGTSLTADYIWYFTTKSNTPPTIITTDPVNNAVSVSPDKTIHATFNMAMDPNSINANTFTLHQGTTLVAGTISYSGVTAHFKPESNLIPGAIYTATITTGVKNTAGTPMANIYVWTFTVGNEIIPYVISTDPENNATGVLVNKTITATFSVPMDNSTINSSTFTLYRGITQVPGVVTYSGTTASFKPTENLVQRAIYTATITTGAKNTAGTPMANNYVWSFTTEAPNAPTVISTDPPSNATGVVLNKTITATFSVAMDPTTINNSTFTLYRGSTPVAGVVTYTGTTASFNPTTNLAGGAIYTATITTGAKNTAGTPLANNYVWTFTTEAAIAPTVISTDPLNNATGVVLNKTITATFSEAMDPTTINNSTFTLYRGSTPVTGVVTYTGTTASFKPSNNLVGSAIYTATITTGAKNTAGTPLANNYVWTFTTEAPIAPTVISTDPLNNATGVSLNKIITATFSELMDPTTINTGTFKLYRGATPVSGTVTYSGTTASFNPTSGLVSGNSYTAKITTGAKNLQGVHLANDYVWNFSTINPGGPAVVDLGSVSRFGIIAGVGVSNNAGFSEIRNMDVGISPGVRSSVTGFPPAIIINGAIYASDDIAPPGVAAMLMQAKQDLTGAYLFAEGATTPAPAIVSGDIGGTTLSPGIYKTNSTLLIQSGDLTLDAQGDENAVWIFQVAAGFTTIGGAGGNVILSGGAQSKNVFWQIGSSATIGDFTAFKGNILALTSVTMNSGAVAEGRMLCINGAVVMTNTNIINKP